jgi:hypothetical protein
MADTKQIIAQVAPLGLSSRLDSEPLSFDHIRLISYLAGGLVSILATLAFILSYSSLQHLAAANGMGQWLSYLWPLLLDFAMVVYSLAILRANLRSEPALYPWLLTVAFASMATVANVLDVATLGIPPVVIAAAVKALAPVALVLAFELLMQMVKAELRRAGVVFSLAELAAQTDRARAEWAELQHGIESYQSRISELKAELARLRSEKKAEVYTEVSGETRQRALEILNERSEISGAELGRLLGRSDTLARRLKKELLPLLNGHQNGQGVNQ